jgi:ankyrin repeat protein
MMRDPLKSLKKKKADFLLNNTYGPPWIENEEMFQELIEECTSKSIGLQTIHDCLTQKLDPNLPFRKHNSNRAMHYAARHGNIMMALMLIRGGAKIEVKNALGQTPLMVAASGRFSHHTSFLRWIIGKGADVQAKDRGGNTALVLAVISSARNNIGLLLHHKASVAFKDKKIVMLEDPDAIAIAKYLRAVDNRLPIEDAEGKWGEKGGEGRRRKYSSPTAYYSLLQSFDRIL